MARRTRPLLLVVGLLAPVAVLGGPTPADAADPTVTASATSGGAGDAISIAATGCSSTDGVDRIARTKLVVGTAPDERFAGFAESYDGDSSNLIIPAWVDPAADAVLITSCIAYDYESEDGAGAVEFDYDDIPFDVLPAVADPTDATFSRTTAKIGQIITIDLTGCDVDTSFEDEDGAFPSLLVFEGDDLSGRSFLDPLNLGSGFSVDDDGGVITVQAILQLDPDSIAPGTYVVVAGCSDPGGNLTYEPQVVTVEANPAVEDLTLTVTPKTNDVSFGGGSCTEDEVQYDAVAFPDDLFGFDRTARRAGPAWGAAGRATPDGASWTRSARADEELPGEIPSIFGVAVPAADGTWGVDWQPDVTAADVFAIAMCGDAEGDGFVYRGVDGRIDVPVPPTTTTTTTAPPAPLPPANALPGTPTYAG